jgi:hypothetical protein
MPRPTILDGANRLVIAGWANRLVIAADRDRPAPAARSDSALERKRPRARPEAKLIVLVGVEGDDAKRLERLSEARGKRAADVVAELLRDADRSVV